MIETWNCDGREFTFDPEHHIYRIGDTIVPSVTTILRPVNNEHYGIGRSGEGDGRLAHAADRGDAVHKACQFFDEDDLDEDEELDPEVAPYVTAYKRFRVESKAEILEIERPHIGRYGPAWFAGRPDRIVIIGKRGRPSPLDIKTTETIAPAVGMQLAAYGELRVTTRASLYVLQLFDDGTYKLTDLRDRQPRYLNHFRALLTHHTYMEEYRARQSPDTGPRDDHRGDSAGQ